MISDEERFRILSAVLKLSQDFGRSLSGTELMRFYAETTGGSVESNQLRELHQTGDLKAEVFTDSEGTLCVQRIEVTAEGLKHLQQHQREQAATEAQEQTRRWEHRWRIVGWIAVPLLVGFITLIPSFLKQGGGSSKTVALKNSAVQGDVSQQGSGNFQAGRDLSVNVIANQIPNQESPEVERRKIKMAIRVRIEDGWSEIERLFQETNALKEQITSQHNARGTLSSGMHLADQAERAKAFNQDCETVMRSVDRVIENVLIEQGEGTFNTADWFQEERKLYESLRGFITETQNQIAQEGLKLARGLGNEALWTELMKK